jgi:hypothetical protein
MTYWGRSHSACSRWDGAECRMHDALHVSAFGRENACSLEADAMFQDLPVLRDGWLLIETDVPMVLFDSDLSRTTGVATLAGDAVIRRSFSLGKWPWQISIHPELYSQRAWSKWKSPSACWVGVQVEVGVCVFTVHPMFQSAGKEGSRLFSVHGELDMDAIQLIEKVSHLILVSRSGLCQ